MTALFFVNTGILMWHVAGGDIYASFKARMAEIRDQVPAFADAAIGDDRATDKPARDGKDVAPPLGAFARPASFRGAQRERDEEGPLRAGLGEGESAHDESAENAPFVWSDVSGTNTFALVDAEDRAWAEMSPDGEPKFRFLEVQREELRVELRDANRKMSVLLLEKSSLYKFDGDSYNNLYPGSWSRWNGKRLDAARSSFEDERRPPRPIFGREEAYKQTIAVMLAAFRDPLCGNTLYEAFSNARYPDRVFAVVVEQNAADDAYDCVQDYCDILKEKDGGVVTCRRDQVRVDQVSLDRARGVMPARYRQNLLLRDEEFCLQIDSHSAFETDWDQIAIEDWLLTENEMAVITAYPNMVRDRHDQRNSPQRCSTKFSTDGEVVHGGNSAINVHPGKTPFLIPFFGAGTSFSKCHANFNVPYDPYMSYLFGGEEFNRAARLFTSGYDLYGPKRNFVYHYYDADKKPLQGRGRRHRDFFNLATSTKKEMSSQTTARWRAIFGLPLTHVNPTLSVAAMQDATYFGLGTRRRIEQFEAYSRVNLRERKTESRCQDLGNIKWQPYEVESPFFPAGKDCPYRSMAEIRRHCCTTLHRVMASTSAFLAKTNEVVGAEIHLSPRARLSDPPEPVVSPSNSAATLGSCPGTPAPWPAEAPGGERVVSVETTQSRPEKFDAQVHASHAADEGRGDLENGDNNNDADEPDDDDVAPLEQSGDGAGEDDNVIEDSADLADDEDEAEEEDEEREDAEDAEAASDILDAVLDDHDELDDSAR